MIRNTFAAKCEACKQERPRCAECAVLGTSAWNDKEWRTMVLCGPCRRECKGRVALYPRHKQPKGETP